ncbi:MAG: Thermostable carboxypeptidase 1 [Chlamydiae bacterium]|nr:Thermostable carboxypeptidase 1 [Chlamydiota bacterium]
MIEKSKTSYQKLEELSKRAAIYTSISHILEWDQETKMPKEAIGLRTQQNELIASLIHKEQTSPEFAKTLGSLIDLETGDVLDPDLSPQKKAALREWRRDYLQAVKLPTEFVEEFAKVTSTATAAWQEARPKNDFKAFQPHLEKIIKLNQKKADFLGYEDHPYDALINSFEPEMKTAELTTIFERLKIPLMNLLKKIQTKEDPDASFLQKDYPHDKQIAFSKQLLQDMGFEDSFSRLDESVHPMCVPIHPKDMRMTTRVYPNDVAVSILSCAHEGGHGLYHIHLPEEHFGTPLGESASLGIDESQSRTWETLIGRSLPFWEHYFPKLQKTFPDQLGSVHLEDFYKAINIVEPSMIRVDSDEVSYNLHVLLRFELEKALLEEKLKPSDIPDAWNEKMREYLSITPKAHSEGSLQDIHWAMGAFGYFPTYTLGNLYAAQFFVAFAKDHPNWKQRVAKGELYFISDWQKEKIHRFGREFLPEDLCEKVTGSPLSEKPYIEYLKNKYTPLYHL